MSTIKHIGYGETIYCNLKHVSKSGMTRHIQFFMIRDNMPYFLTHEIAITLDMRLNKNGDGVKVQGCGMDMGFHVVDLLSRELGFKLYHQWI